MKKSSVKLTTAQFAKLHEINKRTLHYYDNIGLFGPNGKGDNGYRYYDISQSLDFEYIRMLKELDMTIEEIRNYRESPTPAKFLKIAHAKEKEIDMKIKKMEHMKRVLQARTAQIRFCETLQDQEIRVEKCRANRIYILPFDFADDDISQAFSYIKDRWSIEQIHMGIGGFISLDKIVNNKFEKYDGLFTPALGRTAASESIVMPEGNYLCGYQRGTWDNLPDMYEKMLGYAGENHLKLTGYAYEQGLNEFVISTEEEYITKIMIQIQCFQFS